MDTDPLTTATIVDVLENTLDGELTTERVNRMSSTEMADLFDAVNLFYEEWRPAPPADDLLRVHLGGWVARTANQGLARDLLDSALLYAHQVVIYDPIAAYFEPNRTRLRQLPNIQGAGIDVDAAAINLEAKGGYVYFTDNLEAHRSHVGIAVEQITALAPLIRENVAVPVPHLRLTLKRQEQIFTAIRYLLRDPDYLALLEAPVDRPVLTQDDGPKVQILVPRPRTKHDKLLQDHGDAAYYLARTLALAEAAQSSYLPPSGTEWAIYEQRLQRLGERLGSKHRELYVAPAIVASELPFLSGLPPKSLIAARRQADGFEHWRAALRKATRQVRSIPAEGTQFVDEASRVLRDELNEVAEEVQLLTRRSKTLARSLRQQSLTMSTGAAGVAASAALLGKPIPALSGVVGTGMMGWLADALLPKPLNGTKGVLAHFVHHQGQPADMEEWPKRESLLVHPKR